MNYLIVKYNNQKASIFCLWKEIDISAYPPLSSLKQNIFPSLFCSKKIKHKKNHKFITFSLCFFHFSQTSFLSESV